MRSGSPRKLVFNSALRTLNSALPVVRLQKFLADAGVASRRAGEQFILDGRVAVNDQPVRLLGTRRAGCFRRKSLLDFKYPQARPR